MPTSKNINFLLKHTSIHRDLPEAGSRLSWPRGVSVSSRTPRHSPIPDPGMSGRCGPDASPFCVTPVLGASVRSEHKSTATGP